MAGKTSKYTTRQPSKKSGDADIVSDAVEPNVASEENQETPTTKTTEPEIEKPDTNNNIPDFERVGIEDLKLGPLPKAEESPFAIPKVEQDYTTEGIKKSTDTPGGDNPPPGGEEAEQGGGIKIEGAPPPPEDNTLSDPPPVPPESTAPEPDPLGQEPPQSFTLPPGYSAGSAKRVLDAVDYALKNYGKYLTDIRVTKKIQYADRISETSEHKNIQAIIDIRNEKTREELPFEKEDRQLLDPAFERYMRETGIVVTPLQELLGVLFLVLSKKIPVVVSILQENKEMLKHISAEADRIIKAWEAKEKKTQPDTRVSDADYTEEKDKKQK